MIRRRIGDDWLLFTQSDHAKLAADLAAHFGNDRFAPPRPAEPVLVGVAMHDAGWPLHDEQPTLNPAGEPLDVFEVPRPIALEVWSESATRAAAAHPYAGLLSSIHVLALSVYATQQAAMKHEKFDTSDVRERFAVNQFQHEQIELQEQLRAALGLHTDQPLKYGLAVHSYDPLEQKLAFDFRLLQAMDQLSLAICCTEPPTMQLQHLHPRPGERELTLQLHRPDDHHIRVDPWPFDADPIDLTIPFRRLPARPFQDEASFRAAFGAARIETFPIRVSKGS